MSRFRWNWSGYMQWMPTFCSLDNNVHRELYINLASSVIWIEWLLTIRSIKKHHFCLIWLCSGSLRCAAAFFFFRTASIERTGSVTSRRFIVSKLSAAVRAVLGVVLSMYRTVMWRLFSRPAVRTNISWRSYQGRVMDGYSNLIWQHRTVAQNTSVQCCNPSNRPNFNLFSYKSVIIQDISRQKVLCMSSFYKGYAVALKNNLT